MTRYQKRIGPRHPDTKIVEAGPADNVPLTDADRAKLARLCDAVEHSLRTAWIDAGKALAELRNGERLYRETHRTWQAFVFHRFGFSEMQAYRMMTEAYRGARLAELLDARTPRIGLPKGKVNLGALEAGKTVSADEAETCAPPPVKITERHARALGKAPQHLEAAIVERAQGMGGALTAAKLASATKQVMAEQAPPEERKARQTAALAEGLTECAKMLASLRSKLETLARSPGGQVLCDKHIAGLDADAVRSVAALQRWIAGLIEEVS